MKKFFAVFLVIIMAISLCACGSSAGPYDKNAMASSPAEAPMAPSYGAGYVTESAASEEWYADSDIAYPEPAPDAGAGEINVFPEGTKMVYTAYLEMQTTEFDSAIENLREFVNQSKGYFESSSVSTSGSYRYGNYTVRIPAANYRVFVDSVGADCLRTYFSENAEDISEVYYDTQSRLETQKIKLDRYQALLEKAESTEEIIALVSAISDTEWEIERLSGNMRHYDSMVGYSTVEINLREVYKLANVEEPAIGFGAKLGAAFKHGCQSFVNGLQDFVLAVAYGWVTILIILVIAAAVVIICLRHRSKKKKLVAQRIAEYQKLQSKAGEEKNE